MVGKHYWHAQPAILRILQEPHILIKITEISRKHSNVSWPYQKATDHIISVFFQLPRREALSVSVIFAALDPRIYYCASGMSGARKSYHIVLYTSWTITNNHVKDRRASYHILTAIFPQCLASNFKYRKYNFAVSFAILNCRKHIYGDPWTLFFLMCILVSDKAFSKICPFRTYVHYQNRYISWL